MNINDLEKLNNACKKFGIDASKAITFKNVIVVPGNVDGLYVVFDKNYNPIDVRRFLEHGPGNMYNYFEGVYLMYKDEFIETFYLSDVRDYNSESLSVSHVVELSDRYDVEKSDNGRDSVLLHDGDKLKADTDTINFMSYMQFLRKVVDKYYPLSYKMKEKNISYPSVDRYVNQIISEINFYIDRCIMMERRPDPIDFIDLSEKKSFYLEYIDLLSNIFDLLLKHRGYKNAPRKKEGIVEITDEEESIDLNEMIREAKIMCSGKSIHERGFNFQKKKVKNKDE